MGKKRPTAPWPGTWREGRRKRKEKNMVKVKIGTGGGPVLGKNKKKKGACRSKRTSGAKTRHTGPSRNLLCPAVSIE